MNILLWIILGALAGFVASYIMKSPHGILMDIVLGIIGAFVGGFVMNLFGQSGVNGFNFYSILVSIIGAIIVLALYRMFERRTVS